MMTYTLGFLFGEKDNKKVVWLIKKTKPDWQIGLLNGIGGKLEYKEPPIVGICREFKEETGVETIVDDWYEFCEYTDANSWRIHCFTSYKECHPKTTTDEEVACYEVDNLPEKVISGVRWLISLALNTDRNILYSVVEKKVNFVP
jgi:8-oxo-dGTP pyrophosphatase MutT (NUDIX family)